MRLDPIALNLLIDFYLISNLNLPGGNSEVDPLLPIPNRIVKRFSADDSARYIV